MLSVLFSYQTLAIMLYYYVAKNIKLEEDDHYAAIGAALSQLHILCEKIDSRSITFKSLNNIRSKEAQFKKLCDTASSDNQDMYMMFSQVKPHLDQCYYLQSRFVDHRDQISTLLEFCSISYGIDKRICMIHIIFSYGYILLISVNRSLNWLTESLRSFI